MEVSIAKWCDGPRWKWNMYSQSSEYDNDWSQIIAAVNGIIQMWWDINPVHKWRISLVTIYVNQHTNSMHDFMSWQILVVSKTKCVVLDKKKHLLYFSMNWTGLGLC